MDHFKVALEKKKTGTADGSGQKGFAARKKDRSKNLKDTPDIILYTQTKQISVNQRTLSGNRLIAGNRSDPRATYFRLLRTQVLRAMRDNGWSSLAVTGPTSGVGKTLVACNLAISMAHEANQTVLLVDMDLRRPSIHKFFDFDPELGLLDFYQHESELNEIFINPGVQGLTLLPGRGSTNESSDLLSSPSTDELIEDISNRYRSRLIVYDLPPLINIEDAMVFLPNVDSSILVVENGKNTESEVKTAMRLVESHNLIGTVLNKSDEGIKGYYG